MDNVTTLSRYIIVFSDETFMEIAAENMIAVRKLVPTVAAILGTTGLEHEIAKI